MSFLKKLFGKGPKPVMAKSRYIGYDDVKYNPYSVKKKAGAGITIRSLEELDDKLANLTPEQKKEMKKQAVNLAQKLNKGRFLQDAFRSL